MQQDLKSGRKKILLNHKSNKLILCPFAFGSTVPLLSNCLKVSLLCSTLSRVHPQSFIAKFDGNRILLYILTYDLLFSILGQ